MTLNNDAQVKKDRLRFTKNKLSSSLTLLAIVFNALYFVSIYKSDVGSYYYKLLIGISIIYNLLFMLAAFLSSEGVKSYKMGYAYLLIALGIGQIVRIFIIPMNAKSDTVSISGVETAAMEMNKFWWVTGCLVASAALLVLAGVIAIAKTATLKSYQAELERRTRGNKS